MKQTYKCMLYIWHKEENHTNLSLPWARLRNSSISAKRREFKNKRHTQAFWFDFILFWLFFFNFFFTSQTARNLFGISRKSALFWSSSNIEFALAGWRTMVLFFSHNSNEMFRKWWWNKVNARECLVTENYVSECFVLQIQCHFFCMTWKE